MLNDAPLWPMAPVLSSCLAEAASVRQQPEQIVWGEPREITSDLPPAPPFEADVLLPPSLAGFVLDEADRMPCPPDYIAAALVVALGATIGARCALKPKRRDDWIVTPNLFGGVVGDPSSKKSPAIGTVTRFVDRLEAKAAERQQRNEAAHEAEVAAFRARQDAIRSAMKKAAAAANKGDLDALTVAASDFASIVPPDAPHERRFKSNDATVEKLGDLLSKNPEGLLVFRDELTGLLASWEREGREGDRAFYLESWNGTASFSVDRIARGSLHVPNLCLSVFGGIQPDLLERYLSSMSVSLDNDGRMQRFQVLVYPAPEPWAWRDRCPAKGAREAVRDAFDRLACFDLLTDGASPADDFVKLPYFHFDDAAQEIFIEWCTDLHARVIASEQDGMLRQHFSKYEKLFCSLALILHLASGQIGDVKADSALRAAAWCEYLAGHARRIYGLVGGAKVSSARTLARKIAEGRLDDHFTARDVSRKQWGGLATGPSVEAALSVLEDHGWLAGIDSDGGTGRPTRKYLINPAARAKKS